MIEPEKEAWDTIVDFDTSHSCTDGGRLDPEAPVIQRLSLLMTLGKTGTSVVGVKATLGRFKEAAARRCSLKGPKAAARAEKREKRRSRLVPRPAY